MNAVDLMMGHPVFVTPDTVVSDAVALMVTNRLSSLPVTDSECMLHGEVTAAALIGRVAGQLEQKQHPNWMGTWLWPGGVAPDFGQLHGKTVNRVMSKANVVAHTTSLEDLILHISRSGAGHTYVVIEGRLVGVVSLLNVLQVLANHSAGIEKADWSELDIRVEAADQQ